MKKGKNTKSSIPSEQLPFSFPFSTENKQPTIENVQSINKACVVIKSKTVNFRQAKQNTKRDELIKDLHHFRAQK